jgi:hypothetical protein
MRYNVGRYVVLVLVLIGVVGGSVVSLGASTTASHVATSTLEPQGLSVPMTLGQWQAERASQGQEDEPGWDCRVQGNGQCGTVWWELVCPEGPQQADTLCALEPHSVTATPNE